MLTHWFSFFSATFYTPAPRFGGKAIFFTDSMSQNSHAKIVDQNKCSLEVKANKNFFRFINSCFYLKVKLTLFSPKFQYLCLSINVLTLSAPQTNQGEMQSASSI